MHEMMAGADPQGLRRAQRHFRRALGGHEAAIGADAGEARRLLGRHRLAQNRMDAVGGDHGVGRHAALAAVSAAESEFDAVAALRDAHAAAVEADNFIGQPRPEKGPEVGAVGDVAGRAVEPDAGLAHVGRGDHPAVAPVAEFPSGIEPHREGLKSAGDAEPLQRAHHVGRDHNSGPDVVEGAALLVDGDIDPPSAQEQRRRQPAETCADDRDPKRHARCSSLLRQCRENRAARKASRSNRVVRPTGAL